MRTPPRTASVVILSIGILVGAASGRGNAQVTSSFNGRVVDQADAIIPGVVVVAMNTGTGVSRETVTNGAGLYTIPALPPGIYDLKATTSGFAESEKKGLTLTTATTLTVDFTLSVASLAEQVEVTSVAPQIETTRSAVSSSLQTKEVESLPILNRSFTSLVTLLPGARQTQVTNATKNNVGQVSFGGGNGRGNVNILVDGATNRDDINGGVQQNYTLEGVAEFKLLSHNFEAQYGRASGSVIIVTSKSGSNGLRGSVFGFGRSDALTATDYFTKSQGQPKNSYSREQFGGSVGGPIKTDRAFFFVATERIHQDYQASVPAAAFGEAKLLEPYGAVPVTAIPRPYGDTMLTSKVDIRLTNAHALTLRYSQQRNRIENAALSVSRDSSAPFFQRDNSYNGFGSHTWVINNRMVNQVSFQYSNYDDLVDYDGTSANPLGPFKGVRPPLDQNLVFPSVTIGGAASQTGQNNIQHRGQFQNNFSAQLGNHQLNIGGEFSFNPLFGGWLSFNAPGTITFFDDPSTIVNNTNGRYPLGFQTPGIVSSIALTSSSLGDFRYTGAKAFGTWVQDDWRATPRLTLNLGLRYDVNVNYWNQPELPNARSYQTLKAIGDPAGNLPKTPYLNLSPRAGLAWDLNGDGRSVLRGGYGLFYDSMITSGPIVSINLLEKQTIYAITQVSLVNTAVGVGQAKDFVFGVSPLPVVPPPFTELPTGLRTAVNWFDPSLKDPRSHHFNVGFARQFSQATTFSTTFTHTIGRNEYRTQNINPFINGVRRLVPSLQQVYGDPNLLGNVTLGNSIGRSRYDELVVNYTRRQSRATFQASYTLSGAYAYGGDPGSNSGPPPQTWDCFFCPGEWGPSGQDERHRFVLSGVFNLFYGIEAAPIIQVASGRPYTLRAGRDLNGDGANTDRYVDPSTGEQASVNSQRGEYLLSLDSRLSKHFHFSQQKDLTVFVELYNITNRANFGNNYQGNALARNFKQPIAFLSGLPEARQAQFGVRFTF